MTHSASLEAANPAMTWRAFPGVLVLGSASVFFLLAMLCIWLSRDTAGIAAVWLPNAIAIAWLLRARHRHDVPVVLGCVAGNVAAGLAVGDAPFTAVGLTLANMCEIGLAVTIIRRWSAGSPSLNNLRDLLLVVATALIAPLGSAFIAGLVLTVSQGWSAQTVILWYLADGLGVLIILPICLIFADVLSGRLHMPRRSLWEWCAMTLFAVAGAIGIFAQTQYPLLFLADLIMVAFAFRLGLAGTAIAMTIVAVVASVSAMLGTGPVSLVRGSDTERLLVLQTFLGAAFAMSLPVSAVLARRERELDRQTAERRELALLTSSITDAILRFDKDGICRYASPSTRTVLGADPAAFLGIAVEDRAHPESRDMLIDMRNALLAGQRHHVRFTYRRLLDADDGSPVYIEADCAVSRDPVTGLNKGIVVSARDVTERVELERLLKRARRHAENAARAKAQFLANMSHEIRTPMNGVLGFADLLQQMDLSEEAAHHAALIVRSGRSMMALLNDILDISKIESGQLVLAYEAFDPCELVEDCVRLHQLHARQKGIALRLTTTPGMPPYASSDPLRVRQILLNLIANAVKFTDQGSVEIGLSMTGEVMQVTVEDTGIGIASNRMNQIFDPFIQAEGSTTRRFGGTGLGLSISRQLAEMLGGMLTVTSRLGSGSRFVLTIPLEAVETPENSGIVRSHEDAARRLPHRARILLAEDHDINRMLVAAMLEQMQQDITIVHDGLEAAAAVRAAADAGAPFDLVLMDVQMPHCDGYAATRRIRTQGISATDLPIVALTANAYAEDITAALDAGMQDHLAKPLVYQELADTLIRWLPVRIVDETTLGSTSPTPSAAVPPANGPRHSPEMLTRWAERRSEAMQAVSQAVAENCFEGVRIEDLARIVHKLAGTAGMFGEETLGAKAAALERALRANVESEVRRKLAEELLAAA